MSTRQKKDVELPEDEHREFYLLFRQQVVQEDNLVNHRMSWLLLLQAYLLAILGGALSQGFRGYLVNAGVFKWLICVVGILGTIFIGIGIRAAEMAIDDLKEQYNKAYEGSEHPKNLPKLLGCEKGNLLGMVPLFVPFLCIVVWVVIGVVVR